MSGIRNPEAGSTGHPIYINLMLVPNNLYFNNFVTRMMRKL